MLTPIDPRQQFSYIPTHLTEREKMLLYGLSRSLVANATIVEIGSYLGASSCFLAAAAKETGAHLYCVDTWQNDAMSEGSRDTFDEFLENTRSLKGWITPLRGRSTEVASIFSKPIDLLFIDGDHSYEAVRSDLDVWLPKVKDGGVVVFHDYGWAAGVRQAVWELVCPIQSEGWHTLDITYWSRVRPSLRSQGIESLSVTIVVPTYGRPDAIREVLLSLKAQTLSSGDFEVVVVDNSPTGDARVIVEDTNKQGQGQVHYVHEPRTGLHHARHTGAREAKGEILVYVDDDVIVPEGWLEAMVRPYDDPQVACVGGKVLPQWEAEPPVWLSEFGPNGSENLSILDMGDQFLELSWPQGVYGCNMSVRRSVLYEVGGFNPDAIGDKRLIWLRGDGETGLQRKIYDAGYKVVYEPRAWLYHRVPASRLRPEYFYWRRFIQGISDSYTVVRINHPSRVRLMCQAGSCIVRGGRCYVASFLHLGAHIRLRAQAWYWYGQARHRLRVAFSQALRDHVFRDTYM